MDNSIIGEEILKFLQKSIPEQDEDQMIHTLQNLCDGCEDPVKSRKLLVTRLGVGVRV